jgi:hypothetical protein
VRTRSPNQLSLFDEPPTPIRAVVAVVLPYRDALLLQVIRDTAVLREDVSFHVPSTEFFVERIAAYKAEILQYGETQT